MQPHVADAHGRPAGAPVPQPGAEPSALDATASSIVCLPVNLKAGGTHRISDAAIYACTYRNAEV